MKLATAGLVAASVAFAAESHPSPTFKQFCFTCHGKAAMGGISLEKLLSEPVAKGYPHWEKVIAVLEGRRMPPPRMPQPSEAQRTAAANWIRSELRTYAARHAGDPGRVTVRRLTSAEYA